MSRACTRLSKELERDLDKMIETIEGLAGGEFNINSPKQLATVLFEKLGLKPIRKTKTGYSTDEDTLTQLATQHELPAQIVNYRSLSKLKSTYVDALPELVNPETKRLHTSLNQTVAATGRLSSTEPNLQNIPVKGEYGLRIREAFIAPAGHTLLCADYSQIEPRILAHLSQDPRLLAVFAKGEDIHMATAMEIFGLPSSQITRDMRRVAKTVVFGIVYGISPFGLASNIGVSQADAKKYIETFFEKFSAVRALMDRNIEEGKTKGYTTTILGRRRPIPELQSGDPVQRGFGERMAVNSPIQGSAADLIKVAMINVNQHAAPRAAAYEDDPASARRIDLRSAGEGIGRGEAAREDRDGSDGEEAGIVGAAESGFGDRPQLASGASVVGGVAATTFVLLVAEEGMEADDLLCSRNARPGKDGEGRQGAARCPSCSQNAHGESGARSMRAVKGSLGRSLE